MSSLSCAQTMNARHLSFTTVFVFLLILETNALTVVTSTISIPVAVASWSPLFASVRSEALSIHDETLSFENAVLNRHSCKRFRRFDDINSKNSSNTQQATTASQSDPVVVQRAMHCLDLARRTPTAFNTQPYKVVLVHSPAQKLALSYYCLGPNAARVRDSDCTAIFLADRQVCRTLPRLKQLLADTGKTPRRRQTWWKMQFYIALFSSGYPLPRLLAAPISFGVRTAVSLIHFLTGWFYPIMPSLANAETWSSKQAMMVAMTYMLGCTSIGLATSPMEGINARGIRKVIQAPSRYSIPLIVSTGLPYNNDMKTPSSGNLGSPDRYAVNEMIFEDSYGSAMQFTPLT